MPLIRYVITAIVLAAVVFMTTEVAHAQGKDDFLQQLKVSAETSNADGEAKKAFYKGNVKIRQGTLAIDADELVVSREEEGKEIFITLGNPVRYSQLDDDGKQVTAQAKEIKYEQLTSTVTLIGEAKISLDGQITESELITYNIEEGTLDAGVEGGNERVVTTYQPKPKAEDEEPEKEEQP
jgi:lipopolysaccharide export system protein LptA